MDWVVVVPVKPTARAKTRLGLSAQQRGTLARAFAADLIAAAGAAGSGRVVIVAGEDMRPSAQAPVAWVADPDRGLNPAIAAGAATAGDSEVVLALMGDLPCATAADLRLLLEQAEAALLAGAPAVLLADQAGLGSTALAAARDDLNPAFGPRSRARHRAAGAVELTDPRLARLRRDVDSLVDLSDALRLGVGPNTSAAARDLAVAD